MDRNLAIALTLAALAAIGGYGLAQRLREGYVQFQYRNFDRASEPGAYWTVIAILACLELASIVFAIRYFLVWL